MVNQGFSIAVAARRSGLSQHVIRAWEKRYGVITPSRTDTRRRLYTDEDIEHLVNALAEIWAELGLAKAA